MARLLRVEFPGAIYHVTCRMIGGRRLDRSRLFRDDKDRRRFVERLGERVEQYEIRLYLFVLMTNHLHLLFETPEANCSKFMQSLSTAYTVYYNLRHRRHGHLLDGRYKAKLVEGQDYLRQLSRYVHLNPVKVGPIKDRPIEDQIKALRAYAWSSYPGYLNKRTRFKFVETRPILAEMGGKRSQWPKRYREFVETGLAEDDEEFRQVLRQSPRSIGGDGFRAWIDELYQKRIEGISAPEDVAFRRITEPLAAPAILATLAEWLRVPQEAFRQRRRNSPLRAIAARMLIRFGGLTQRQAAAQLAMGTGGAVSAQVRRLPDLMQKNRRLRQTVTQVERKLEKLRETSYAQHHRKEEKGDAKC